MEKIQNDKDLFKQAPEALRQIVGQHGQWNNGMWAANIARAAIKAVEGEQK